MRQIRGKVVEEDGGRGFLFQTGNSRGCDEGS